MSEETYKYWGFISYSHQDTVWASWLHKALENYRVPKRLVGRAGRFGPIPRRLTPMFRDRDELSSSAELGTVINEALRQSRFQIVICSPRAASSRWVNEELRYFKSLGRPDSVLALIVDGEPGATEHGNPELECFPRALRFKLDADGSISDRPTEPIAADARPGHDSREASILRLVAGLIGVGYDELIQREKQQQRHRRLRWASAAITVALATGVLWKWQDSRQAERARQAHLFALFDLGRKAMLDDRPASAATYLGAAYSGGYDTPALHVLLGQAMSSVDATSDFKVHHVCDDATKDDQIGAVAWMSDGQNFVTAYNGGEIWSSTGDSMSRRLGDSRYTTRIGVTVDSRGQRVLVEGKEPYFYNPLKADLYDSDDGRLITTIEGHSSASERGPVFRNFSPDGKLVVLIEPGHGAVVYDTLDGGKRLSLRVAGAQSAGFSPDGTRIVTGDSAGAVAIWAAGNGKLERSFVAQSGIAVLAFFDISGKRILVTDLRGGLRIFDSRSGQLLQALAGHLSQIAWAKFSADGQRLATVAEDGAKVWDLDTGQQLLFIACGCTHNATVDLSADGTELLGRVDSNRVGLWNVDNGRELSIFEGHINDVTVIRLSPDGKQALIAARNGDARIWNLDALRREPMSKVEHDRPLAETDDTNIIGGNFRADGKVLASYGTDGTVRLWNAETGAALRVLRGHTGRTYSTVFSPDGRQLASGSDDNTARLWDVETGTLLSVLPGHTRFPRRLVYTKDGTRLLSVGGTEPRIWDTQNGHLITPLKGMTQWTLEGQFSADERRVLINGFDPAARIWSDENGQLLATLDGREGGMVLAAFIDDSRKVIGAQNNKVRIWDSVTGMVLGERSFDIGSGAFRSGDRSHDSRQIALSASTGEWLVFKWKEGVTMRLVGHGIGGNRTQFSQDDEMLLTSGQDATVRLWDLKTGLPLRVFKLPSTGSGYWVGTMNSSSTRVLTGGYRAPPRLDGTTPNYAELWNIAPDHRDAATIAHIVACKSPWQLNGDKLVPAGPAPADCATQP